MNFFHPETLVFWTTLFFLLFFFLFIKLAWKPILKTIKEREESIENALLEADKAREEMAKLKADNQKILNEARAERDQMLKEAKELKEQIIAKAREEAQIEANKEIDKAKAVIQSEKQAAIKELKNQVSELSINIAEKVIGEELKDKKAQIKQVEKLISDIKLN
jgi:F-type H+-transporting ATPase subunit b